MTVIMTFTFCCDNLWKHSLWLWKKPGKLWGIFFLLLCVYPTLSIFLSPGVLQTAFFSAHGLSLSAVALVWQCCCLIVSTCVPVSSSIVFCAAVWIV